MNDQQTPAGTTVQASTSDGQDSHQAAPDGAAQPRWGSDHPVNIRLTIPLLFRSYYIAIVAGSERRSRERRIEERKKHPLFVLGNIVFLFVVGSIIGIAALAALQWLAVYTFDSGGAGMPG